MEYKHLVFDIDGTLVDNEKAVLATWQETILQLFGKHYETSELNFVLGIPGVTTHHPQKLRGKVFKQKRQPS